MELEVVQPDKAKSTEVGSYFVANYPPFSVWSADHLSAVSETLATRPGAGPADQYRAGQAPPPIGLYMHIPFCRKRCKFCYFRVYTDKNGGQVEQYLAGLTREIELYRDQERFAGREFDFVYFGGGTPSFLSEKQLLGLVERINQHWRWDAAREVTFECEPGTLKKPKLEAIKSIGVTRLSLGVEHFDDEILETNGRAHKSPEIFRAYDWVRDIGFQQVNCDLIAGMVGETDAKWRAAVEKMIELSPDSVTIYQMELPHNTKISRDIKSGAESPIASWAQKRAWVDYAFAAFEKAGYVVSSAYTMVKPGPHSSFVYRDALWHGADMVGTGVASFSHVGGTHYQNLDDWDAYLDAVNGGALPLSRALPLNTRRMLIREFVLQLKLGGVKFDYFAEKFGENPATLFKDGLAEVAGAGLAKVDAEGISLTRAGLLRVDELLPAFFESEFRNIRYT